MDPLAGDARVDFSPSRVADMPLAGTVRIAGDAKRISNADVNISLGEGRLQAKGAFGRPGDSMAVAVQATSLAALSKPFGWGAGGRLDARATLTGTFAAPGGQFDVNAANLSLPGGFYMAALGARGEIATEANGKVDATIDARGITHRTGEAVRPLAEKATLALQGTRSVHALTLAATVTKDSDLRLALQGGLDPRAPRLLWQGNIASLALTGPSAFQLARPASLVLAADRVELGDATLKGDWGEARFAVTRWTPALIEARGSSPGLVLREAARALRLQTLPRGGLSVAGEWDIRAAETVDGVIQIVRTQGDLRVGDPPQPLGLEELKLRVESRRGKAKATASVRGRRIGQLDGEVEATLVRQGAGLAIAPNAPLQGHVEAKMDSIGWVAAWLGPEARADGRASAQLTLGGTMTHPRWRGRVEAENVSLREPLTGFEVEKGVAALALSDTTIVVEKLSASTPWHPSEQAQRRSPAIRIRRRDALGHRLHRPAGPAPGRSWSTPRPCP
jgi:translocation and assembly module TamB